MFATLLRTLGFDLQQQTNQLQARAEAFRDHTIDRTVVQVRQTGLAAGWAVAGGVLLLVALGIGLLALYRWVAMHHGDLVGLGAAALAAAVLAGLMFTFANAAAKKKVVTPPVTVPPIVTQTVAAPQPLGTSPAVASMIPALPPGAPLLDVVTHRVTSKAAAASDEAIASATELVRSGSRGALYGTLAVTALAGLLIGRRKS